MTRRLATLATVLLAVLPLRADEPRLVIDSGGHTAKIQDVIFTPDGRHLVSAGDDKVVRVWDVATGHVVRTIRGEIEPGDPGKIYAAALSPDGRVLAVGGWLAGSPKQRDSVRLHDFATGDVTALLEGHSSVIEALAFSPDGRFLASGSADDTVRLWNVKERKAVHVLRGHTDDVYGVAFSPDGKRLASGSFDHTVRLWDVGSGDLVRGLRGHDDKVKSVAFSPDGRFLASGSWDRTIRLWDAVTGEEVKVLARQETGVGSLSFRPDGKQLLTGVGTGGSKICHVFAVPSGDEVSRFQHDNVVLATAYSPDGKLVATGGGDAREIELWRPENGERVRRLAGHGHPVRSVAFAKDGRSLAFGQSRGYRNVHHYGPLERTFVLSRNGRFDVTLGEVVDDESRFVRARPEAAGFRLETPSGGIDPRLRVVRDGTTVHEIVRDTTSGLDHRSFTFNRDGRFVVSGGGWGDLTVYDRTTGKKVHDLVGHTGDVWAVAVSPDDRFVASGSADQTIRLWDLATGKLLVSVFVGQAPENDTPEWVAWTPDGYYTASPGGDRYVGWHVSRGVDQAADYFPVHQYRRRFYRPDVVAKTLELRDTELALLQADRLNLTASSSKPPEPPPSVFVFAPADGSVVTDARLHVQAAAVSTSAAITDFTVTLNGRVVNKLKGTAKGNPRERKEDLFVNLQPGTNVLTFVAATDESVSEVVERRVTFPGTKTPAASRRLPKLAVLAIGIADYDDESFRLDYADDDAVAVAGVFAGQEGRAYASIVTRVLGDDERADRGAILHGLQWLRDETPGTGDVRVLFLSGHGDVDGRGDYYFLAQDHTPGEDPELNDVSWLTILTRLTEGEATAVLMVDTCHAAAAGRRRDEAATDFTKVVKGVVANAQGLVTFAASTGWEVSVERDEWGHGAFTEAVLRGLRDGEADGKGGPRDGVVEAKELGSFVIDWVKEATGRAQKPSYTPSPGLDDLELVRTGG